MSQIYNAIVVDVYDESNPFHQGYEVHVITVHNDPLSTIDTKKQLRNPAVPVHLHAISG